MFNIGGGEFLVIAVIALIVLGPTRLPDAARQVGKALGELRRLSSGFQNELKDAFEESDRSTSARPASPARDVLGAGSQADDGSSAGRNGRRSTAARRPRRTTPLRAEPDPSGPQGRSQE